MVKNETWSHFPTLVIMVFMLIVGCDPLAAQDFKFSADVLTPSPVNTGTITTSTITVTPTGGFNQVVTLIVSSCPTGAQCTLSPTTVNLGSGTMTSVLTVVPSTSTPVSSSVSINATSGGLSHTASVMLNVQAAATPDTLKNDLGFGVALGLTTNVTGPNIVTSATVDANGIVRVNTRANTTAGLMLETHYFIWPKPPDDDGIDSRKWGTGPFVAVQPGSTQIISAVGAGWMVGFRRRKGSTPSGFGLGVGYEAIPAAQVLGSEFVDGRPAPTGTSGAPLPIRFQTQDKGSLMVILSVTF